MLTCCDLDMLTFILKELIFSNFLYNIYHITCKALSMKRFSQDLLNLLFSVQALLIFKNYFKKQILNKL